MIPRRSSSIRIAGASRSCPDLLGEAYRGDGRLDGQLTAQFEKWLADDSKGRYSVWNSSTSVDGEGLEFLGLVIMTTQITHARNAQRATHTHHTAPHCTHTHSTSTHYPSQELTFTTTGGKLALAVNGKGAGAVSSKPLCKAFCGVYTDKNAVCKLADVGDA